MSTLGTKYIASVVAKTGPQTDIILEYLFEQRKNQIENIKTFQDTQMFATNELAKETKDVLFKQADATEQDANASIASGSLMVGGAVGQIGYQGYRDHNAEFTEMNTESKNLTGWEKMLKSDSASEAELVSGPLGKEDPISLNSIRENGFAKTTPENDSADVVKRLRGSKSASELQKDIDSERTDLQNRQKKYNDTTYNTARIFEVAGQGIGSVASGAFKTASAEAIRDQAKADALKTYGQNFQQSTEQNIQTTQKAFDGYNQAIDQAAQNYITYLARANQAA